MYTHLQCILYQALKKLFKLPLISSEVMIFSSGVFGEQEKMTGQRGKLVTKT